MAQVEPGFEGWYRAQHPRLLASMVLLAGSLDEAQEATDEALARALLHWRRVAQMDSPGGWVYRVAANVLRRRSRRAALERRLLARGRPPAAVAAPAGARHGMRCEGCHRVNGPPSS